MPARWACVFLIMILVMEEAGLALLEQAMP